MGDNLEVPPSSDRQGIHFTDLQAAETEQKMWFHYLHTIWRNIDDFENMNKDSGMFVVVIK